MDYLVVSLVPALVALVGGGYLGYRFGRRAEAKLVAARIAAAEAVAAVKRA